MAKSQDAFRTIGEVAEWLGAPTHVLRFWESRFTQIRPIKGDGGSRFYRQSDMALLGGIKKLLQEEGLTIRGVQALLRERGVPHVAALSPPLDSPVRRGNGARIADQYGETEGEEREADGAELDDGTRNVLVLEPAKPDSVVSPLDPAFPNPDGSRPADAESERAEGAEREMEPDNVLVLGRETADIGASQPSLPFDAQGAAPTGSCDAPSRVVFPESGGVDVPGGCISHEGDSRASGSGDCGSGGCDSPEAETVPSTPIPVETTHGASQVDCDRKRSALAGEVLALLRDGRRADSEDLRPLHDRLRNLRDRIAPDQTGSRNSE